MVMIKKKRFNEINHLIIYLYLVLKYVFSPITGAGYWKGVKRPLKNSLKPSNFHCRTVVSRITLGDENVNQVQ